VLVGLVAALIGISLALDAQARRSSEQRSTAPQIQVAEPAR
jgi:hypothetical protein